MANLLPLQIPSGWAVLHNVEFNDEPMHIVNGYIDNNLSYKEDVLSIVQAGYQKDGGYQLIKEGYWLDLGWYPDSDPKGSYTLVLFKGDWEHTLIEFKSPQKGVIQKAINQLLFLFYRYPEAEALQCFNALKL